MPRRRRSTLAAKGLRSRLEDFCRRNDLDALYVFGSRAEEVNRLVDEAPGAASGSRADVDIGILPVPSVVLPADRKVAIAVGLEDLLGVCRVDLVVLPEADPFVAVNVIRGERLFSRDAWRIDE